MSYLLEALARGWPGTLSQAFGRRLAEVPIEAPDGAERSEDEGMSFAVSMQRGLRALSDGDWTHARAILTRTAESHSHEPLAFLALACCLDELGLIDAACSALATAANLQPQDASIQLGLGYCHERQGRVGEAITHYQHAIRSCPILRPARERLAAVFIAQQELDKAVEQYGEMLVEEPGDVDIHLTLAGLYLRTNQADAAVQEFERALVIEPDNWQARSDLADTLENSGLLREAIEALHALVEQQPASADTLLRLGDLYARCGNDAAALQNYLKAIELHPRYLEATVKAGTQYLRSGQYQEAAQRFTRAIEINDRLLTAYVGLGVAQHAAGRPDDAGSTLELAASIEPNSTLLYSEVARLQLKCAAQQESESWLGIEPDEVAGPPEHRLEDITERQIELHQELAAQRQNHPDIHYRLGLLLRQRGRLDEAIVSFRRAVAINPSYTQALIKLGLALQEAGSADEAIATFQRALSLHPEYVDLHYRLGVLFASRRQFEAAVEHFGHAASRRPGNEEYREMLALTLENLGLVDRAKAMWHRLREMRPARSRRRAPHQPT